MKLEVSVVRVYGTQDRYGGPLCPPLSFDRFPQAGWTGGAHFGVVPEVITEAERARRAIGRLMLDGGVFGARGLGEQDPADRLENAYQALASEKLFGDYNWFVTLHVSTCVEVQDGSLGPGDFAFTRDAFALEDKVEHVGRDALDVLCAVASALVEPRFFASVARDDRVLFFAKGLRPAGVPRESFGPISVTVEAGDESRARLATRISELASIDLATLGRQAWLARGAHWRTQALCETDPWKRFLWNAIGIEIITHRLYDQVRPSFIQRLRMATDSEAGEEEQPQGQALSEVLWAPDRAPLAARFALVAIALSPGTANDDIGLFKKVKEARDNLAHGQIRDADMLPQQAASALFEKLLASAIRYCGGSVVPTFDGS